MHWIELTVNFLSLMQKSEVSSKLMIVLSTLYKQNRNGLF